MPYSRYIGLKPSSASVPLSYITSPVVVSESENLLLHCEIVTLEDAPFSRTFTPASYLLGFITATLLSVSVSRIVMYLLVASAASPISAPPFTPSDNPSCQMLFPPDTGFPPVADAVPFPILHDISTVP